MECFLSQERYHDTVWFRHCLLYVVSKGQFFRQLLNYNAIYAAVAKSCTRGYFGQTQYLDPIVYGSEMRLKSSNLPFMSIEHLPELDNLILNICRS
jgi:hypothetical protein